jgi:hypothetical protein
MDYKVIMLKQMKRLSQKHIMIIKNPDLRNQMSDEYRKFVKNKYLLETTYGKLEQDIKNLYYSKHKSLNQDNF